MNKTKYIYILSQRYSGSTLLSFLLATHPAIATIGERRKFYNKSLRPDGKNVQTCSCGQPFLECPHWNEIKEAVLARLETAALDTNFTEFEFFKNKHWNRLGQYAAKQGFFSDKRQQLCNANEVLVEEILKQAQKSVFLDASKVLQQAHWLSKIPSFDFYVIWLVRDPRAQVSSALKYNKWSVQEAAQRWTTEMKKNEVALQKGKFNYLDLHYENLCKNPMQQMERILDFVGLDASLFSLDFRTREQHIMGNTMMRLGKDEKIVERKDWLKRLTPKQIKLVERTTHRYKNYHTASH